ncbi:hypothetical protein TorRG33x02_291080, partial [Trema orientale]
IHNILIACMHEDCARVWGTQIGRLEDMEVVEVRDYSKKEIEVRSNKSVVKFRYGVWLRASKNPSPRNIVETKIQSCRLLEMFVLNPGIHTNRCIVDFGDDPRRQSCMEYLQLKISQKERFGV